MHYCTNAFVLFFFDLMAAWLNKVRCPGSPFCQLWYIQHDGRIPILYSWTPNKHRTKRGKKKNRNQRADSTKAIKSYSSLLTCEVKSSILASFVVCFCSAGYPRRYPTPPGSFLGFLGQPWMKKISISFQERCVQTRTTKQPWIINHGIMVGINQSKNPNQNKIKQTHNQITSNQSIQPSIKWIILNPSGPL